MSVAEENDRMHFGGISDPGHRESDHEANVKERYEIDQEINP